MTGFWVLIEESAGQADRAWWIERRLAARTPAEIVEFDIAFTAARRRAETWTVWAAGYRIMSGLCSADGFWYFLPWLVGLGRDSFDRVVADPDALADVPQVRRLAGLKMDRWTDDDWPEWEALNYVSRQAYDTVTGENEGIIDALRALHHEYPEDPAPTGDEWDFDDEAEMGRRLPRLSALFPTRR
ncbi:DUF4240 domain-containing protein [Micromonospora sp. CB01531]|uniref:DUF4240 domain-containing protein n=1 Tax=Micromonospora sp. CB01531 TaxID=1718947 RepID=UPI000967757B|nr:DUF4240 domain-containing protein [Micromonospora sp. CB01531]OKI65517.1 hypothetical protein A6A27_24350 [Micromonospora sp. CB01531]